MSKRSRPVKGQGNVFQHKRSALWHRTTADKKDFLAAGRILQRYFDQQSEFDLRRLVDGKPN